VSWSWWGAPGVLVMGLAWTLAVVAIRAAPGRRLNRLLAGLLLLEGAYSVNIGLILFVESRWAAELVSYVGMLTQIALPFFYLLFLGEAIQTPLTRPFRGRAASVSITLAVIALCVVGLLRPSLFITEVSPSHLGHWNYTYHGFGLRMVQFYGLTHLFGLVAAVLAFRGAPVSSIARGQAALFILAFGLRDAYMGVVATFFPVLRPIPMWGDFFYNPGIGLIYAAYVPLLAYAILKYQLFSIDLRLKLALRQGSTGAMIAGVFLIVSEALESVVAVDGIVAGIVIALMVALLLRPAQNVAERFVGRLLPGVQPDETYFEQRRLAIFQAALESATIDGQISVDERDMLTRLQTELGLATEVSARLEREALARNRKAHRQGMDSGQTAATHEEGEPG
jgi:hypothetical protein